MFHQPDHGLLAGAESDEEGGGGGNPDGGHHQDMVIGGGGYRGLRNVLVPPTSRHGHGSNERAANDILGGNY